MFACELLVSHVLTIIFFAMVASYLIGRFRYDVVACRPFCFFFGSQLPFLQEFEGWDHVGPEDVGRAYDEVKIFFDFERRIERGFKKGRFEGLGL